MEKSQGTCVLSYNGLYRYTLTRDWGDGKRMLWIMLNPSTATAEVADPTIRRCEGFARSWAFGGMTVCNIFALRSTDPRQLVGHPDPCGVDNDDFIGLEAVRWPLIVAAWGSHASALARGRRVMSAIHELDCLEKVHCLGVNKDGSPKHPLYVRATAQLIPYRSN